MAHALLLTKPEHFVERAKASGVVREIKAEIEAKERRKAQRRTGHFHRNLWTLAPRAARFLND